MPLVFVHGVANRLGENYSTGVASRDALFRRFIIRSLAADPASVSVRSPYWGDLGGRLRWHGASMPLQDFESLGTSDATLASLQAAADPDGSVERPETAVLTVARRSLGEAVDLLWSAAGLVLSQSPGPLAELGAAADGYAVRNPRPSWLFEVRDDAEFLEVLRQKVESDSSSEASATDVSEPLQYEALGLREGWNAVAGGAAALRRAAAGLVGRSASDRIRPVAIPSVANFLGDVFVYLHQQQDVARPIGELVEGALRAAAAEREDGDPLIVVAHSMGGIITYDLLTSSAADLRIDLLVTVGTQIGFFEELKLFTSSDPSIPGDDLDRRVAMPAAVQRWINVFDYSDLLGYAVGPIIDGVDDYAYRTGSLLKAHSTYFLQPGFHRRLANRAVPVDE